MTCVPSCPPHVTPRPLPPHTHTNSCLPATQDVRIDLRHLVSMAFDGDTTPVQVWRGGRACTLDLTLGTPKQLVPVHNHDQRPKYFIYAGLVSRPARPLT